MDKHQTSMYHSTFLIAASSLPLLPILIYLLYMSFKTLFNSVSILELYLLMVTTHLRSACSSVIHVIKNHMNVRYSAKRYYYKCEQVSSVECAICLGLVENGDEIGDLKCTHVFHKVCLESWVALKTSCPICRSPIMRGEDMSSIHQGLMQPRTRSRSRDRDDNFWLR